MTQTNDELNRLIGDLTCSDVIKCQNARRRLVAMGEAAVPSLEDALHHKDHWVHWEAAKALSQIASPAATRALIDALEHTEFEQRWLAAEGLASIGRTAVPSLLMELMKKPQSVWLQQGAHHVLSEMAPGEIEDALVQVIKAIEGPSPSVAVPVAAKRAIDSLRQAE